MSGNIEDYLIENIFSNGSWRALSLFSGVGNSGTLCWLRGITARGIRGTAQANPIHVYDYAGLTQADNIVIEDVTCLPLNPAVYGMIDLTATKLNEITLRGFVWGYDAVAAPTAGVITIEKPVRTLNVEDLVIQGAQAGTYVGIALGTATGTGTVTTLRVAGLVVPNTPTLNFLYIALAGSSITTLEMSDVIIPTATGALIRNSGPGTLTNVLLDRIYTGAMSIYRSDNQGTNPTSISASNIVSNYNTPFITNNPLTLRLANCNFNASTAIVSFKGTDGTGRIELGPNVTNSGAGPLFVRDGSRAMSVNGVGIGVGISTHAVTVTSSRLADRPPPARHVKQQLLALYERAPEPVPMTSSTLAPAGRQRSLSSQ